MRLRKQTRRAAIVPLQPGAALDPIPDTDMNTTPERSAEREQMRRLLEAEIDSLPDDYRAVFMLRAVEELTVEETAAALEMPEATVRTRFFRARALMRGALERDLDRATGEAFAFDGERCDRIVAGVLAALDRGDVSRT